MFLFDYGYFWAVLIPSLLISGAASLMVRSAFNRYSRVRSQRGITGAEAAYRLLQGAGIGDVQIVETQGYLSDHYDPTRKRLALSPQVFRGNSVASIGVAAHEAGHAIQHAQGYAPLRLRSALVPTASIGSQFGYIAMFIGLMLLAGGSALGPTIFLVGVVLFGFVVLFQLITLPVEFDATARAKRLVLEAGIITPQERTGMDRVLNAAALTYVAALITSLLTLAYFLLRSGLLRRD